MTEFEEDAFEAQLAASKRRKRLLLIGAGLVVLGLGVGLYLYIDGLPEPRCDADDVDVFLGRSELPPTAVRHVCRFPPSLDKALAAADSASPDNRKHILMSAIVGSEKSLIIGACGASGLKGLANALRAKPEQQAKRFLESCDLSESEISFARAYRSPIEQVVLAIAVYEALRETDPEVAPKLANRILSP